MQNVLEICITYDTFGFIALKTLDKHTFVFISSIYFCFSKIRCDCVCWGPRPSVKANLWYLYLANIQDKSFTHHKSLAVSTANIIFCFSQMIQFLPNHSFSLSSYLIYKGRKRYYGNRVPGNLSDLAWCPMVARALLSMAIGLCGPVCVCVSNMYAWTVIWVPERIALLYLCVSLSIRHFQP